MEANQKEFLSLIDEYQKIIHKVCSMYTDNRIDHEDLFQEILTQLWIGYGRFNGQSKLSTWIYRVSLYTSISYIKKVIKDREGLKELVIEEPSSIKTEESDEELMKLAIKKLERADKAFILLYLEDKSYKEMSEILGISESNVGVKLNRIKKKLKILMG